MGDGPLARRIAYLEDRGVLGPALFDCFKPSAARFFEVLAGEGPRGDA